MVPSRPSWHDLGQHGVRGRRTGGLRSLQESLRKVVTRNVITDHPSPNLWKKLPAIPIILAPVTQNHASPISPVEAAVPIYHQRCGFQRKSTKAERQTGNALAAAAETTKCIFVPNKASQDHLNTTPAITVAMTANKSSAKSHSTRSSKKTNLPVSIFNSMGEAGRDGVRIGKLGKPSLICNLGWDTTSPNCLKMKSRSGRLGPDVKPIPMRHSKTRFGE